MNISELKKQYAAGATPSDVIGEIWEKIIAWDDPAIFIHLPEKYDAADAFSREMTPVGAIGKTFCFGVPKTLDFAGDPDTPGLFLVAVERLKGLGRGGDVPGAV